MTGRAKKGANPALLIFDLDVSPDHLAAAVQQAALTARRAAVKDAQRRTVPVPSGFRADLPPSFRQSREELQEVHDLTQRVAAAEEREAREEGREVGAAPHNAQQRGNRNRGVRLTAADVARIAERRGRREKWDAIGPDFGVSGERLRALVGAAKPPRQK